MTLIPGFWLRASRPKRITLLVGALLCITAMVIFLSPRALSPEEQVKAAVLEAINAAEAGSRENLAQAFSMDYRGFYGSDYRDLLQRIDRDFTLIYDLRIRPQKWLVTIQDSKATVQLEFTFHLVYRQLGVYRDVPMNRIPSTPRGQNEKARLELQNEGGVWKIIEIDVAIPDH